MELALPLWVMLAVGGLAVLIAIAGGGTLVEGIIMSAILSLAAWFALSQPLPVWGRQLALSAVVGMISGLIAVGIYSDFFASRTVEHDAAPPRPAGRKADDRTASLTVTTGESLSAPTEELTEASGWTQPDDDIASAGAGEAATSVPPPDPAPQVPRDSPASTEPPTKFAEYSTVRIARLIKAERFFEAGADEITRWPRIGDEGIVVDTGSPPEGERQYMVECLTDDGDTVWIAEFSPDELEPATGKTEESPS